MTDFIGRNVLLLGILLFTSCASTGGSREVKVEFDNDVQGGWRRFFTVSDLTVADKAPEYYDLTLESDRPAGMLVGCNGTRNLAIVGTGDEAAFRALVGTLEKWGIDEVPQLAEAAGITPGERPADYWTPAQAIVKQGAIIAVRNPHHRSDADGRITGGTDIRAMVFVHSIDGDRSLVLHVAKAPAPKAD